MNNWRLLLLAVVAVLQPIGSFTQRYLIDGHQECCDHGSDIRDTNLYGTFRKSVHEQRLSSRIPIDRSDTRENRHYETRDENPLLRRSVERIEVKRRFFTERGRSLVNPEKSRILGVSRLDDSKYERNTFKPTGHVPHDASRLSRTERTERNLGRDNRNTESERRMRETETREVRQTENRRSNTERDILSASLRENRAFISEERRNQQIRMNPKQNLRQIELDASRKSLDVRNNEHMERNSFTRATERKSDDRVVSRLAESREQKQESQRSINNARNIRSVLSRDDNRMNERADQTRERETNKMSDERVMSRLRESRERLEPQRAINLARNIRSVLSRDDNRINERVEQRQRENNRMSDERVMSRLRESRERLEPQRATNLARNIRSVQSRDDNKMNERVEQRQRENNRMSDERVMSRLRESRERLEPLRAIKLARSIRSVQSRDDNRMNERADQRRERESNRMSDERVTSRQRESQERLEPQRATNSARNIRSVLSRDDNRINERVEQRQRENNRMSDERVMSRLRESRERLEPQRAIKLARSIRSVQSRDDNRMNERADQRRERESNRMSDERVTSRQRESQERLEPQRATNSARNIRSVLSREYNRMNERADQTRERETNKMSDERVTLRLRESRERLEPQRAINLARNIRSVQSRDDNRINERVEQRQRETNRMSDERVMSRLRESRERLEPQRAINLARNIRSVQSHDDNRMNERADQRRERESNRMSDERLMLRLRKSQEHRVEPQGAIKLVRKLRSVQRREDKRINKRVELRQPETNRMSEERLSRLRESRQAPEERLDRRSLSLSRIGDNRNRQETTRRHNNRIDERSEAREQDIRESRDRMVPEKRNSISENSRLSRSSDRNDERLQISTRSVSAERRIVRVRDATERNEGERNRDFRSSQREATRDRRPVDDRADSHSRNEIIRVRATLELNKNLESRLMEQRTRHTIPSTLRDVRNERELRYRAVFNRDPEIQRELKSERHESKDIRLKSADMGMERIERARESRNRIQSTDNFRGRETLIHDKSDKLSFDMNWQYLFYTLQGAYLCGLLVQLLTEKSINPKTSNFSWLNPVSNNLIKVD